MASDRRPLNRWTSPGINMAAKLWAKGLSAAKISEELRLQGKIYTNQQILKLAAEHRDKFPYRTPQERYRAQSQGLKRYYRLNPKPSRPGPCKGRKPDWFHFAAKLWAEGLTARQISEQIPGTNKRQILGLTQRNREIFPKR